MNKNQIVGVDLKHDAKTFSETKAQHKKLGNGFPFFIEQDPTLSAYKTLRVEGYSMERKDLKILFESKSLRRSHVSRIGS